MSSMTKTPPIYRGLTVGIVGVLAVAIAPILLTRLYETGRISAEEIGIAVCIEFIAMALGSVVGAKLLSGPGMKLRLTLVCIAMAASNVWTPYAEGALIMASRAFAGLFGGMMIWIVITTIIRSATPERWSGIYLSGHTAVQFGTATIIAALIVPQYGASGGYLLLAAVSLALIPVALAMPDIEPIVDANADTPRIPIPMVGWLLLVSIFLMNAMFSTLISYAEVEFQARDYPVEETLLIVPVILLVQMVGGLCASVVAARSPQAAVVVVVSALLVATTWFLSTDISITQAYVAFGVFGFCWLFIGPFHLGILMRNSDAPQTAELLAAAQLLGLAFGPLVAAGMLTEGGYPPALYNIGLIGGSVALLFLALASRSKPAAIAT